jgi:hypothetical protein
MINFPEIYKSAYSIFESIYHIFLIKKDLNKDVFYNSIQELVNKILLDIINSKPSLNLSALYREKTGHQVIYEKTTTTDQAKLEAVTEFNIVPQLIFDLNPLNPSQLQKALAYLQEANQKQFPDRKKYYDFLIKSAQPHATRMNYTREDWKILDRINVELIREHFKHLNDLFNSSYYDSIQEEMKKNFQVDYKESLVSETLAKSLAYIPDLDGKTLDLPVKDQEGRFHLVQYQIKLYELGDALPCYILEADQASPWLVIRGTEPYLKTENGTPLRPAAAESILADVIDSSGIAEAAVIKSMVHHRVKDNCQQENLTDFFYKCKQKKILVNLTGHSLGGYFANDITIRFHRQIKTAYGFSAPGVNQSLSRQWKRLLETKQVTQEKIVNFDIEGDLVPGVGEELVGKRIALTSHEQQVDPIHAHLRHNLNRDFTAQAVDIELEKNKFSRKVVHLLRGGMGKGLKNIFSSFKKESLPDWWVHRQFYQQQLHQLNKLDLF